MGEANMKFARGENEEAVKMCMEVIRLVPTAPEPFQTLGMLYEELGDTEKALQVRQLETFWYYMFQLQTKYNSYKWYFTITTRSRQMDK